MFEKLKRLLTEYPDQFWLMAIGMLISTIGVSMIWPFMTIYAAEKLDVGLAVVTGLLSFNSVVTLLFSFIAGAVADRIGRKWVMIISLIGNGVCYILLSSANSLPAFAVLMGLRGIFQPLYQVGSDAMMADMVLPEKRAEGYSILRMSNNLGVAIGPAVGGFVTSSSYTLAFFLAAAGLLTYSLLLIFKSKETLKKDGNQVDLKERFGGYSHVLRDRPFISFNLIYAFCFITASMIWVLLAVYAKEYFGVPEKVYGFIPATNAIMVVTLQFFITRQTKKMNPLAAMALGAMFYAGASIIIGVGNGFWLFLLGMIVMTFGELIMVPTATTFSANLAPADKRARYMSVYGMSHGISSSIGPLLGGSLSDSISARAPWFAGGLISTLSAFLFVYLNRKRTGKKAA
jgi:MFS family permease